ncbi:hypothetical protein H4582DRAFT_1902622 [Lactarius indigo]|nr:hypothetical protein H4582DRAFT_1902622 [Lactarius indigo]
MIGNKSTAHQSVKFCVSRRGYSEQEAHPRATAPRLVSSRPVLFGVARPVEPPTPITPSSCTLVLVPFLVYVSWGVVGMACRGVGCRIFFFFLDTVVCIIEALAARRHSHKPAVMHEA